MRAIGAFAADSDDQAGCGNGCLRLGTSGIGHLAMAWGFGGEGAEAIGVDLGPDEGDPKSGQGRRQHCLLAVHGAKRSAGGQSHNACRVVALLCHIKPGR
jgi:hypothetical protein